MRERHQCGGWPVEFHSQHSLVLACDTQCVGTRLSERRKLAEAAANNACEAVYYFYQTRFSKEGDDLKESSLMRDKQLIEAKRLCFGQPLG